MDDVVLIGGGLRIVYDTGTPSWNVGHGFTIDLSTDSAWRIDNEAGALATEAQIRQVLADLQQLLIRAEYSSNLDTTELQQVAISVDNGDVDLFDNPDTGGLLAQYDNLQDALDAAHDGAYIDMSYGATPASSWDVTSDNLVVNIDSSFSGTLFMKSTNVLELDVVGHGDIDVHGNGEGNTITGGSRGDGILGKGGGDTLYGVYGNDALYGGNGSDSLLGGTDDDMLFGGNATDFLYGDDYRDSLFGGQGVDSLYGGSNKDVLNGDRKGDFLFGGGGEDSLYGGLGADDHYGENGNDSTFGGQSGDTLYGGNNEDLLIGGKGNDSLFGGSGFDRIKGGGGHDFLQGGDAGGGSEADQLFGGSGNDTLVVITGTGNILDGGSGDDTLTGGVKADVFVMKSGYNDDIITNFIDGADSLRLDDAIWGGGLTAAQVVSTYASIVSGELVFDFLNGTSVTLQNWSAIGNIADSIDII
ncbi:MAG: hypothetical protein GY947_05625 [Rhodobacteraceae bacterium]|nr:hypothetical protein [Paracoccaceae bacterium]